MQSTNELVVESGLPKTKHSSKANSYQIGSFTNVMPSDAKEKKENETPVEPTLFDSLFSAFGSLSCLS
jgi:hypothetical protein